MTPDANSYIEMLRKFGSDLGLPKLDVDKLIEAQKKNIDALSQSAQVAAQGAWIPAARQASGQPRPADRVRQESSRNSRQGSPGERDDRQAIDRRGGEDHPGSPERKL